MNFERVAARFQQRLADTVAKYEADIILLQEQYEEKIQELEAQVEQLKKDGTDEVVPTETDNTRKK
jgi:exonuclease III